VLASRYGRQVSDVATVTSAPPQLAAVTVLSTKPHHEPLVSVMSAPRNSRSPISWAVPETDCGCSNQPGP